MMKSLFANLVNYQGESYQMQVIFFRENNSSDVAIMVEFRSNKTKESYVYELGVVNGIEIKTDENSKNMLMMAFINYINGDYQNGKNDIILQMTAKSICNSIQLHTLFSSIIDEHLKSEDEVLRGIMEEFDAIVALRMIEYMNDFMNLGIGI